MCGAYFWKDVYDAIFYVLIDAVCRIKFSAAFALFMLFGLLGPLYVMCDYSNKQCLWRSMVNRISSWCTENSLANSCRNHPLFLKPILATLCENHFTLNFIHTWFVCIFFLSSFQTISQFCRSIDAYNWIRFGTSQRGISTQGFQPVAGTPLSQVYTNTIVLNDLKKQTLNRCCETLV